MQLHKKWHHLKLSEKIVLTMGSTIGHLPNGRHIFGSNEILDNANLDGTTISIDAIGCQSAISEKIINKGGKYFLALKGESRLIDV